MERLPCATFCGDCCYYGGGMKLIQTFTAPQIECGVKCCCIASGVADGSLCSCLLAPVSLLVALWPTQPRGWWEGRSISCSRAGAFSWHQEDSSAALSLRKQGVRVHTLLSHVQHHGWGEADDFRLFTEIL